MVFELRSGGTLIELGTDVETSVIPGIGTKGTVKLSCDKDMLLRIVVEHRHHQAIFGVEWDN